MSHNLIVIAGGPGAGKTTLIEALRAAGYATAPEAGRAIIQDQVAIGGPALPWKDPALFAELMLSWDLRSYRWAARRDEPVFFDHALAGLAGYYRLIGREVPEHVYAAVAAFRYSGRVFVAPPWPEIYRTDAERRQSWAEAVRTYEVVTGAYAEAGYELVELPRVPVGQRLEFILRESFDVGQNRAQTRRLA
ncbi:AAA family ATPase [Phytohabitans aurantiacus]|uniref:ATPase n=1 Tax=Phytohabitans aurantiacus TaxID=3016789 RepID=A0ABQ5QR67_9ACTN|nr:AAA family ATPase [Phytohabitans aurantiacus]GLH96770.1 ATPase [Phytohabitans aurantiacus]